MPNFLQIVVSEPFTDASATPVQGYLTVTPSSMFRAGGGGQCDTTPVMRRVIGGVLVDGLLLANPALTSPQGIGYTFTLTDSRGAISTWEDVRIADDGTGNYDLAQLDTGQFTAVPQSVILVNNNASAGDFLYTQTGNTSVSAYTAVCLTTVGSTTYVIPASSADPARAGSYVGLATQGATANQPINVQISGQLTYNGWSWIAGEPIFLGINGALTQTAPFYDSGTGYLQILGTAVAATTVQLAPQIPLLF